jgi:phage shock protein C
MNTTTASPETDTKSASYPEASGPTGSQPLYRPFQDRMLAGVAVGIARYLGVDVTVVRIVLAVLTFFGGAGVAVYLAGWLLIPEEGSEQSIASQFIQSLQARSR